MLKLIDRENDSRYKPSYYCITSNMFNVKDTETFTSKKDAEARAQVLYAKLKDTFQNIDGYTILIMQEVVVSTLVNEPEEVNAQSNG